MTSTGPVPVTPRKSLEPWISDSIEYYDHQIEGVRWLLRHPRALLTDDMGLGKSMQGLTKFVCDVVRGWSTKLIVVCPVSLKGNWVDEIAKFTTLPSTVIQGTPMVRQKQILQFASDSGPRVLIINYELLMKHVRELNSIGFEMAIFDEAHYVKNHKSKRTAAAHKLKTRDIILMSGTPMLNHVDELWSPLHMIDATAWPRYYSFVNRYCVMGGYMERQITGVQNEQELTNRLHDVMLRRLKSEVLDLPEVQIIERRVDLLPEQQKLYDQVVEEMRLTVVDEDDPQDIENALTKFLRLKQICGTTWSFSGVDVSGKLDLAVEDELEILENDRHTVSFTQFRDVQACFVKRLEGKYPIYQLHGDVPQHERGKVVNAWAASTTPAVLSCMVQVAGVGLNMTAARDGSFLDELFVPGLNQQAIDRLNRIGASTTQAIQIRKYITRNTVENRVQQILRVKSKLFGEIVENDHDWKKKLLKAILEAESAT